MAGASSKEDFIEKANEKWKPPMLGPLPPDFLRIQTAKEIQEQTDCQVAMSLYQQQQTSLNPTAYVPNSNVVGRLSITVAQAKLVRNYGLTRMDPYCRVRVGHYVYESQTDPNGGKNPRWNRVIHSQLPNGVTTVSLEIYDECSFKMDELIAWAEIKIPDNVLHGETHEEWYPLSGKQGDDAEGSVNMVFSFSTQPMHSYMYQGVAPPVAPVVMVPNASGGRPLPVMVTAQQPQVASQVAPQPVQPIIITDKDMTQVQEMFPNIDSEVIKSVFEANRGNKAATINCLLQMNE